MSLNSSPSILSVSNLLRTLIEDKLGFGESSIVYESPGELDPLPDTGLSLYIYKISENPFLKNNDMVQHEYGNPAVLKKAPLPLDLHYLITPFGGGITKLITLENILQLFHEQSIMRENILPPDLVEKGNKELRIVLNDLSMEQVNSLWGLFPNTPYSLSVSYIVTPVLIESTQNIRHHRVSVKDTFYYKVKK